MPYPSSVRTQIPAYVIAVLSDVLAQSHSHAMLDNLFMYAGAPGDPPQESKPAKVQAWLRRINTDPSADVLTILGRLVEPILEYAPDRWIEEKQAERASE